MLDTRVNAERERNSRAEFTYTFSLAASHGEGANQEFINYELRYAAHEFGCALLRRLDVDISPELEQQSQPLNEDKYLKGDNTDDELAEPVELEHGKSIHYIKLWINELLHNCVDHAFTKGDEYAQVHLRINSDDTIEIECTGTGTFLKTDTSGNQTPISALEIIATARTKKERLSELQIKEASGELDPAEQAELAKITTDIKKDERSRGSIFTFEGVDLSQITHENAKPGFHDGFIRATIRFDQLRRMFL